MYSSVCLLILNSKVIPSLLTPLVTSLFSMSVSLFLFINKFICSFLFFLDSTYKWCYTVLVFFLSDISFSMIISRLIHVAANDIFFHAFSYGWVTFYCIYMHCICMHACVHSSVNGHLGCLHIIAILNSAAVNTAVHVSSWIVVLSRYMPRSGNAGSYSNS